MPEASLGHVASAGADEDPVLADLIRQIGESDVFRAAPMMRRLLLYLWRNRGESISEYAIATEALGRARDFDSRTDASVRVHVARLRAKLAEFYSRERNDFPLQLCIPVGGHEIEWSLKRESVPAEIPAAAVPAPAAVSWRNPFIGACIAAVLLAVVCIALAVRIGGVRAPENARPVMPRFWKAFLASGKPADIVIPDLPGFRWPDQHIYVIAPDWPDFEKWRESPFLSGVAEKWGPPSLNQTYIFGRDAFAGFKIHQYLEQRAGEVEIVEGATYAADLRAMHNTILVGLPSSSAYIRQFSGKLNFRIVKNIPLVVQNEHPLPGEPARYEEQQLSEKTRICPAILALLPKRANGARTMLLAGRYANIFSSMLLSDDGLKIVDDAWRKAGSPDAWEMVIKAEIENNTTIVKTNSAALRPIGPDFWN